jgi:hypothetical protein
VEGHAKFVRKVGVSLSHSTSRARWERTPNFKANLRAVLQQQKVGAQYLEHIQEFYFDTVGRKAQSV